MRNSELDFYFSKVKITEQGENINAEYKLASENEQNQFEPDPLYLKNFKQFKNAIKQYQSCDDLVKKYGYKFDTENGQMLISQKLNKCKRVLLKDNQNKKHEILQKLIECVLDFQKNGLYICFLNFEYICKLEGREDIYCFLILPGLICQDDASERGINLSNQVNHLVRGQLLYKGNNQKLEVLQLLKNYVCYLQKENYDTIQVQFPRDREGGIRQLMKESIFFDEDYKDPNYYKQQQSINIVIAYSIKCNHDYKNYCQNCDSFKETIPIKVFKSNNFDIGILINYLQKQERIQMNELKENLTFQKKAQEIQKQLDDAVEHYYNNVDSIKINLENIKNILQQQRKIYIDKYDKADQIESQHNTILQNLKDFQRNIEQIQNSK